MRRRQRLSYVGTRAEAGIDQAPRLQLLQRLDIGGRSLRLHDHRLVPLETEPSEVLIDALNELGPASRLVQVLDPQQEFLASGGPEHRAIGMSKVQSPGRRRRESRHNHW